MNTLSETRQWLQQHGVSFGAVVLAGGLARRMNGQDKGLVSLSGKPMVLYALECVLPLVDKCVINANRNRDTYERFGASALSMMFTTLLLPPEIDVVPDQMPGHLGPLAGLSAGIEALDTDYVFMCPCDSPFLQSSLVEALLKQCVHEDADIAVPFDGERLQPVFCVVNRRVKSSLDAFLLSGERKIDSWFATHDVQRVDAVEFIDCFANINTEQERLQAEQALSQ
ncbi:MAG: molybdenum cofactor guanylyltransferase MobA [Granulosicoccus sp.]